MQSLVLSEDATSAADEFVKLGFEYTVLPIFQAPYHSTVDWTREPDNGFTVLGKVNLGIRSANTFALQIERPMFGDLHTQRVSKVLDTFGTLRFGHEGIATYVFGYTAPHHKVNEGAVSAGPLSGSSFITTTGWLAFGLAVSDGRTVRVERSGELRHLSDLPDLVCLLEQTQHFRLTSYR
ncbi:MAG TPA: hypothetical protein VGG51_13865 [Candidatus Cybelea sp.]|jgi:hypothetical protein